MDKKNVILFLLMVIFVFAFVNNSYSYDLHSGEAKSKKDPVFIEMPDNMHQGFPYIIKVYINDPIIKKEAKYFEIGSTSEPYSTGKHELHFSTSGNFRETFEYNGEDVIEFGYRHLSGPGYTSTISVVFYKTKKPTGDEYPDTHTQGTEYYGYNCNLERNDLFSNNGEEVRICNKVVGAVSREYAISYSEASINLPSGYDFKNAINPNNDGLYTTVGQSYSYSGKKDVENTKGHIFSKTDSYTITIDIDSNPSGFDDIKETVRNFNKKDYQIFNTISAPGGITSGQAFEKISSPPLKEPREMDDISLSYQLYSQLDPVNSGIMRLQVIRKTSVKKGEGQSEIEKILQEAKQIAASYNMKKGKVFKPNKDLFHRYEISSEIKEEEEEVELNVFGSVVDGLSNPMAYLKYTLKVKDKEFKGVTDEEGNFNMPITDMEFKESETEIPVSLELEFIYNRNNKEYFKILDKNTNNNRYREVNFIQKDLYIEDFEDLEINIDFSKELDLEKIDSRIMNKDNFKHLSVIYFHSHETIEFFLENLKHDVEYNLPIKIWIGNEDDATYYSPSSGVYICAADAPITATHRPDNREYHELSHYLMFDLYKSWPADHNLPRTKNHNGFHNPSTADSYAEGFAEFMAMVISEYSGEKEPEIYANFGSMDENYKPWDARGFDEEFAVASLLWDMYDKVNEEGDRLSFSIEEMWEILKTNRANFNEYYKAFKKEYPDHSKQIDDIFILHGFFADTRKGNGEFDTGEPWRYTDSAQTRAVYIDLSNNVTNITYEKGLTIGLASDYKRENRSNAGRAPDSYLYIEDNSVDFYKVIIKHNNKELNYEYITQFADNKIYVNPLPLGSDAQIKVVPHSTKYTSKEPFIIESKEWNKLQLNGSENGYLLEHDFKLENTGKQEEYKNELYNNVKPNYNYKGDIGGDQGYEIDDTEDNYKKSKKGFGFFFFLLLVVVILLIVYLKFKNNNNKIYQKKTNNIKDNSKKYNENNNENSIKKTSKKSIELTKKHYNKFKENTLPKIKKNTKKYSNKTVTFVKRTWNTFETKHLPIIKKKSKEIYSKTKDFTKKTYHKIKPKAIKSKNKIIDTFNKITKKEKNTKIKKIKKKD